MSNLYRKDAVMSQRALPPATERKKGSDKTLTLGLGTCLIKNNCLFSIIFSKITGYPDYYFQNNRFNALFPTKQGN